MRYLAIDLGDRRTGLAGGDDETRLVQPLRVLETPFGDALREALLDAIARDGPDALVIGLPINMDGTEGDRAKRTRTFGDALGTACGLAVHYQDERLTSHAAEAHLDRSGRTHAQKRRLRDALAAAEILRDFLDR